MSDVVIRLDEERYNALVAFAERNKRSVDELAKTLVEDGLEHELAVEGKPGSRRNIYRY